MDDSAEIRLDGVIKLYLDMSSYARPAVMKVLGRWTDRYAVSFRKGETFDVTLQPLLKRSAGEHSDAVIDSQTIRNELLQEMLRLDIITQTADIRKLLIGRALYATCIEVDKAPARDGGAEKTKSSWEEDGRKTLSTWNGQG